MHKHRGERQPATTEGIFIDGCQIGILIEDPEARNPYEVRNMKDRWCGNYPTRSEAIDFLVNMETGQ